MLPINENLTLTNFNKRGTAPTWIVLHYTANNADTAKNNTDYFKSEYRGASAQLFVDETSIWRSVKDTDTAWAVGNNTYKNGARNTNSINIEMCSRRYPNTSSSDLRAYYLKDETVKNAIELTRYLMDKYNIPLNRVCRHYDVTGKICPAPMVYNNGNITWPLFLAALDQEEDEVTQKEVEAMLVPVNNKIVSLQDQVDALKKRYNKIEDVPEWYKEAVNYFITMGYLKGKENGVLDLSEDFCRMLTILHRWINDSSE